MGSRTVATKEVTLHYCFFKQLSLLQGMTLINYSPSEAVSAATVTGM